MAAPSHHDSPVKWRRLAASLHRQITDGVLQPGAPAPSITHLHAVLGWARPTIAKAMQSLADDGLLIHYDGIGYYVAARAALPGGNDSPPHREGAG